MKNTAKKIKENTSTFDVVSFMKGLFTGRKQKEDELMPIIVDALKRGSSLAGRYLAERRWANRK